METITASPQFTTPELIEGMSRRRQQQHAKAMQLLTKNLRARLTQGKHQKQLNKIEEIKNVALGITSGYSEVHKISVTRKYSYIHLPLDTASPPAGNFKHLEHALRLNRRTGKVQTVAALCVNRNIPDAINEFNIAKRCRRSSRLTAKFYHGVTWSTAKDGRINRAYLFAPLARCNGLTFLQRNNLKKKEALKFLVQLAQGIDDMHRQGLMHRDIKPENVLVFCNSKGPPQYQFQITDFGLATFHPAPDILSGTPYYMHPDVLLELRLQHKSDDIYAWGKIASSVYKKLLRLNLVDTRMQKDNNLARLIDQVTASTPGNQLTGKQIATWIKTTYNLP